ncbi:MAG: hypothetical protein ABWY56_10190, partial [Propionibacteriaceae bacterium]
MTLPSRKMHAVPDPDIDGAEEDYDTIDLAYDDDADDSADGSGLEFDDGDQQDLADRRSLRRVAGMSTELTDITEVEYRQLQLERVVLVSV